VFCPLLGRRRPFANSVHARAADKARFDSACEIDDEGASRMLKVTVDSYEHAKDLEDSPQRFNEIRRLFGDISIAFSRRSCATWSATATFAGPSIQSGRPRWSTS
jgi:hypothetical protein